MKYTAKTLEELLAKAAEENNVEVEELDYTITEENKGVLGIGASVTAEVTLKEKPEEPTEEDAPSETQEEETLVTSDDIKEFLFNYLGNFFMGIDQDLEVAIEEKDGEYIVNLNSENNAVLIGKMGKTLSAFNTVVRAAVNSQFKRRIDVLVDVNGYKSERYRRLRSMAKRIGHQVQKSHVDVSLDPMPNDERKVIHKTLNAMDNIHTESEGEGRDRHVVVHYVPDKEDTSESEEKPEDISISE